MRRLSELTGKKLVTAVMLAAAMTLSLAGCGSSDAASDAEVTESAAADEAASDKTTSDEASADDAVDTSELKPLRVGVGGSNDTYTMYTGNVAYTQGYLEEELNAVGYTLELSNFAGAGPEINEALAAGQLDAAVYGDFPAFTSKSNGIDTTVVASVNGQQQYAVITSNDEIKEAKDLEGKKVIIAQGTVTQFFWDHYATARGLDESKIEIINATSDAQSLLATKDADAYIMMPSSLYYMESLGLGTVIDTGADIPEGSTTYLFVVTSNLLKESPEVGVAINKALIRAYDDIAADQQILYDATATLTITADFTQKDYEFDTVLDALSPEIPEDRLSHYDELNDWLVSHSIISQPVDVDSFIDRTYYKQAAEELGK